MDNNLNPNENLNQNNEPNVNVNVNPSVNSSSANMGVNPDMNNNLVNTSANNSDNSVTNNQSDKRFSLFGTSEQEKSTHTVIMSKQMAEKLVEEKRKEKEANEQYVPVPVSKGKYFLMIVFFIFMFALVWFLPNISEFVSIKKAEREQKNAPVITTGTLTCKMDRTTDDFNISYMTQFSFTDSKLDRLTFVTSTVGDAVVHSNKLDDLINKCRLLQEQVENLNGIKVNCSQSDGTVVETHDFNYKILDVSMVTTSFVEAGLTYPKYRDGDDIDKIEEEMNASGYNCERSN